MRTFIVTWDAVDRETGGLELVKAENLEDLFINTGFMDEDEVHGLSPKELSKEFHENNGIGRPFFMIKELMKSFDPVKGTWTRLVDVPELTKEERCTIFGL